MNTIHRRPAWGIALAGFFLALATACGTDAPADIGNVDTVQQPAAPQPGSSDQQCKGAPQQGGFVCTSEAPAPDSGSADDRRFPLPNAQGGV